MSPWFRDNQTLVLFLVAQAIAIIGLVVSLTAYVVGLQHRVSTLEASNKRIVDVMTRELGGKPNAVR